MCGYDAGYQTLVEAKENPPGCGRVKTEERRDGVSGHAAGLQLLVGAKENPPGYGRAKAARRRSAGNGRTGRETLRNRRG